MKLKLIKDDGWNTEHEGIENLLYMLDRCAELRYELKNCVVGSYYSESQLDNGADLKEEVLCIAQQIKDTAEGIKE